MQDDPLSSVVLLVAVVAVMQAVGLFRQRHPWNTPMLAILGGLAASALATTSLLGEAKLYAELAVLGVGVALVALPSLPERVSTLARVRGEFRRAARFGLLLLVLRPTARSRALYRLSKALRLLDSPAGVGNLAAADALARFPVRVSLFSVEVVYREVRTRLSWLARRAAGLPWEPVAGATELASPAFSAALPFVVQTLVAEGRAEEAAELMLQAERAAEEPDVVVPEEVDAYHNRARLLFAAHAGASEVLARALRFGSTVRPLVTARERSSLRERAATATATALPPELCAPILASLEREARLPSMLTAWQAPGPLSIALFVVNLVTYALSSWSGDLTDRAHLERIGAVSRHLLAEGQLFRLFSSAFLHANWIHLAFNMGALVLVGGVVERLLGSAALPVRLPRGGPRRLGGGCVLRRRAVPGGRIRGDLRSDRRRRPHRVARPRRAAASLARAQSAHLLQHHRRQHRPLFRGRVRERLGARRGSARGRRRRGPLARARSQGLGARSHAPARPHVLRGPGVARRGHVLAAWRRSRVVGPTSRRGPAALRRQRREPGISRPARHDPVVEQPVGRRTSLRVRQRRRHGARLGRDLAAALARLPLRSASDRCGPVRRRASARCDVFRRRARLRRGERRAPLGERARRGVRRGGLVPRGARAGRCQRAPGDPGPGDGRPA
jgi:hypothetical protein